MLDMQFLKHIIQHQKMHVTLIWSILEIFKGNNLLLPQNWEC